MTKLWYMAAPVGAPTPAEVSANLWNATRWLALLLELEPGAAITAPWLATLLAGVQRDEDPAHRERGLRDNVVVARRCDGIVLCGGRISAGMQRELDAVVDAGGLVADLTAYGVEPPVGRGILPGFLLTWGQRQWGARRHLIAPAARRTSWRR